MAVDRQGWNLASVRTLRSETCKWSEWSIATEFGESCSSFFQQWEDLSVPLASFVSSSDLGLVCFVVLPVPPMVSQPVVMGRQQYFGMKGSAAFCLLCICAQPLPSGRLGHWVHFKLRFESGLLHSLCKEDGNSQHWAVIWEGLGSSHCLYEPFTGLLYPETMGHADKRFNVQLRL